MSKRIFKYAIDCDKRRQVIFLPEFAEILSVQIQHGECQLWALVDPDQEIKARTIRVLITGAYIDDSECLKFLGTVQLHDGAIVLHVFEET